MRPRRFGRRPFRGPTIPSAHLAVPIVATEPPEPRPLLEADWSGLCPLEMAPEVWAHWRSRPWTAPRVRSLLKRFEQQPIEIRLRTAPDEALRALYCGVRHSPEAGWRIVLSGVAPLHLARRRDTGLWREFPLTLLVAVPEAMHFLWAGGRGAEPHPVVPCRTPGCGVGVVGRFCTRCRAVARRRGEGAPGEGPLLGSLFRLWRERGGGPGVQSCRCGGLVYTAEGGQCCAKCGRAPRADWLEGL